MRREGTDERRSGSIAIISGAVGALMACVAVWSPRWLPRWLFWPSGPARHWVARFERPGAELPTLGQLLAVTLANWLWFSALSLALLLTALALRRRTLRPPGASPQRTRPGEPRP